MTRSVSSVRPWTASAWTRSNLPAAELKTDLLRFSRQRDRADAGFAAWVLAAVRHQVGVEDGYADTIGWLAWKTGISRSELRKVVRLGELVELLPETGVAWREGRITTTAVELIAAARVPDCDAELVAVEGESSRSHSAVTTSRCGCSPPISGTVPVLTAASRRCRMG